jgi:hypothetical protein
MSEVVATAIAVGDQVRVHFHPPNPMKSFSEGVVRRVDVTTQAGRFFVLEVRNEVLLDQPHRIRPGFPDYVRYECRNDFPGRIEILSTAEQDVERNPTSDPILGEPPEEPKHEAEEQQAFEPEAWKEHEVELKSGAETDPEPLQVRVEHQPVRRQSGLFAAWFGRKK